MAKRIEGPYDFSKHNFSRYADGATWELVANEDFTIKPQSITQAAREWARKEGLNVEYKVVDPTPANPATVALRFTRPVRNLEEQRERETS